MAEPPITDKGSRSSGKTARRLLQQVGDVATELRPHLSQDRITLDSWLDKDLGFDSLSRVELMIRIERAFSVSLSEQAFAAAETPRDILKQLRRAIPGTGNGAAPTVEGDMAIVSPQAAGDLFLEAETLTEVLDRHVRAHPDRPHIHLYDDKGEGEVITYGNLKDGAERVAAGLRLKGLEAGQSVIIMLPTGREYFFSFFGVLLAGGVPVPIYPPGRPNQLEEHLVRHAAIADNCQGVLMITGAEAKRFSGLLAGQTERLREIVTVEELTERGGTFTALRSHPGDTAFLQYTSGSTGNPKGVVLSHRNLLANIRAIGEALELGSEDTFVSWLPLYHDMGLIGAWLGNLHYANLLVIMPPLAFLSRPQRWLWAIHRAKGTLSAAPNFAYELCLSRIRDEDIEGLDLSSWRMALNGAEAINPDTLTRFTERFRGYGLRPDAMMPVFGLAECSVGLTFPPLGRAPVIDRVGRRAFTATGQAEQCGEEENALRFVNCGRPLPGHQIRIVDNGGRELPDREEGRLQFRGPSATSGYFRNPTETADLFDGEWLNTGDLGYIAGGDLYVSGRTKEIIIRAGRNIYPAEFEDATGRIDGIRKGNVAVFGSADPETGTERLIVLAETRIQEPLERDRLRAQINELALDLIGTPPDEVVLAPLRTVLKTSSGKIRRTACREIYEKGLIGQPPRAVWWQVARMTLASLGPRFRRTFKRLAAALFGGWFLALTAILTPLLWLGAVVVFPVTLRWKILGLGVRLILRLSGTRFRVEGLDNLHVAGPSAVFVSNHTSYMDSFVLCAALPGLVHFVAKGELRDSWLTRIPLQHLETVFVERFDHGQSAEDAGQVVDRLKEGWSPLFFAEGTLSRMPGLLPFLMGAFVTAVEADTAIVPVIIRGTRSMLRDGSWIPRPGMISVVIRPPIQADAAVGDGNWQRAVRLRDQVRAEILKYSGEPDLGREESPVLALGG